MQTTEEMNMYIAIWSLGIVFAIAVYIILSRKRRKDFDTLKGFLKGQADYSTFYTFTGDFKGIPLEICQSCGSKHRLPQIWIKLQTNSPLNLEIKSSSRLNCLDYLGEKAGLLNESIKTGDDEFDKLFHVAATDTMSASFLYSPKARQLIQDIFKAGDIESLSISSGTVLLRESYRYGLKSKLAQDRMVPMLEALCKLGLP